LVWYNLASSNLGVTLTSATQIVDFSPYSQLNMKRILTHMGKLTFLFATNFKQTKQIKKPKIYSIVPRTKRTQLTPLYTDSNL